MVMAIPKSSRLKELRAYIKRTGISQDTLAAVAHVSAPTFSKVMKGPRSFTVDAASRLSDFTGIPVEKLLTDAEATRLLKLLGKRLHTSRKKAEQNADVA